MYLNKSNLSYKTFYINPSLVKKYCNIFFNYQIILKLGHLANDINDQQLQNPNTHMYHP